jgi:hypothetical protein
MVKMMIITGSLYKHVVIIKKQKKNQIANNNQCPHHCRLLAESTLCSELELTSSPSVSLFDSSSVRSSLSTICQDRIPFN